LLPQPSPVFGLLMARCTGLASYSSLNLLPTHLAWGLVCILTAKKTDGAMWPRHWQGLSCTLTSLCCHAPPCPQVKTQLFSSAQNPHDLALPYPPSPSSFPGTVPCVPPAPKFLRSLHVPHSSRPLGCCTLLPPCSLENCFLLRPVSEAISFVVFPRTLYPSLSYSLWDLWG
jgi:hypothetical protein